LLESIIWASGAEAAADQHAQGHAQHGPLFSDQLFQPLLELSFTRFRG
jgi:hypothetical protein